MRFCSALNESAPLRYLQLQIHIKPIVAARAANRVTPRDARQAQIAFTFGTFFVHVGLSVTPFVPLQAKIVSDPPPKAHERTIFPLPFINISRHGSVGRPCNQRNHAQIDQVTSNKRIEQRQNQIEPHQALIQVIHPISALQKTPHFFAKSHFLPFIYQSKIPRRTENVKMLPIRFTVKVMVSPDFMV